MLEKAIALSHYLDFKKADDVTLLDLTGKSPLTDYFIIATGMNIKHTAALAQDLIDEAFKLDIHVKSKEGMQSGEWILIDFGDIVAHIFTGETRSYYSLERLWHHAKNIQLDIDITRTI